MDSARVSGYTYVEKYLEVTPTDNAGEYRFTVPDDLAVTFEAVFLPHVVTIAAEFLPDVESIEVPKPNELLLEGETVTLTANIQPQNAENRTFWGRCNWSR